MVHWCFKARVTAKYGVYYSKYKSLILLFKMFTIQSFYSQITIYKSQCFKKKFTRDPSQIFLSIQSFHCQIIIQSSQSQSHSNHSKQTQFNYSMIKLNHNPIIPVQPSISIILQSNHIPITLVKKTSPKSPTICNHPIINHNSIISDHNPIIPV